MNKQIKFSHDYDKLMSKIFPTVRSVDYMEEHELKIGDIVDIVSPLMRFNAKIIDFEDWKICDMELGFLKYDCYPIPCESYQDYVDLLNSFIKFKSNKISTKKRVIWLQKEDE